MKQKFLLENTLKTVSDEVTVLKIWEILRGGQIKVMEFVKVRGILSISQ